MSGERKNMIIRPTISKPSKMSLGMQNFKNRCNGTTKNELWNVKCQKLTQCLTTAKYVSDVTKLKNMMQHPQTAENECGSSKCENQTHISGTVENEFGITKFENGT
jgi:hypothetical protein